MEGSSTTAARRLKQLDANNLLCKKNKRTNNRGQEDDKTRTELTRGRKRREIEKCDWRDEEPSQPRCCWARSDSLCKQMGAVGSL